MNNFNLIQILPELKSGGVEQGTIDVANFLASKKIKNHIISNGGNMISDLNKSFVSHYKLSVNSKNFFLMPFVGKKINKIIKQNNISLLHVRSRAPSWLLPFIDKKKLKTISTFHNIYGHENYFKKIYNKGLSRVDNIIAISNYVKNEIVKIYNIEEKKIKVIERGIDTNFFNSEIDNEKLFINFLEKYNINSNKKIILYPGRLTEWKGQIEFLKVVEEFKDSDIDFYFVGDDKNSSYLKKFKNEVQNMRLENICKIVGHLNKEELKLMYKCSDLIISAPLKPEGFGRTISEGLSMEKIVLAYNFGGAKDQLEKLDQICKINPFDKEELKNRIDMILNSPKDKFSAILFNNRKHVIDNYSKDIMLSKYYNFYRQISL